MAEVKTTANLELARNGATVAGKRELAIRDSFIKETGPQLIRERQQHALKLYLFALWCHYPQGKPRLSRVLENKQLGALLDMGRTEQSRRSAVSRALRVLEAHRLIRRVREGDHREVIVCQEAGTGADYTMPRGGGENAYVRIPGEFFAHGWLNALSAPAILVFLIALREQRFLKYRREKQSWRNQSFDWFQPVERLNKSYGLGTTTIEKGIRELRSWGYLTTEITGRHPRDGGRVAPRNLYCNHITVFNNLAISSRKAAAVEHPTKRRVLNKRRATRASRLQKPTPRRSRKDRRR